MLPVHWVAIAVLIAIIVAQIVGNLSRIEGKSVPASVMRAGVAFGGTLGVVLMIMTHLGVL